jgi:uncharacterized membrane protein
VFRSQLKSPPLFLIALILVNFIYFGLYANQRHLAFETGAFDVGVYTQPLWNFIHGHDFAVSIIEDNGPIRWATHVEPILLLIAPLYWLWPDPRTLLWLQVAGLTLAALPLYALAVRRLQNEWIALVIVLAYFLMPATEAVTLFDFHAVTFAPLFLLSAIYFLDRALADQGVSFWLWPEANQRISESANQRMANIPMGTGERMSESANTQLDNAPSLPQTDNQQTASPNIRHSPVRSLPLGFTIPHSQFTIQSQRPPVGNSQFFYLFSALFFVLAMSTKEEISLNVFMMGLYLLLLRRRWWEGSSLIVVGLVWFYVAFQVIIPAFRTGGGHSIYAAWFETLGRTPLEIALSPITAPDKVLALIFQPGSLPTLGMLTIPLALLPWLGLPLFALAAPSLAISLLSQNPTLRQLETWHYAAPMLPFVMLGAIDGLARASYYVSRFTFNVQRFRAKPPLGTPHASVRSLPLGRTTHHAPVRSLPLGRFIALSLTLVLLVTSLVYHNLRGYSPLAQLQEWPVVTAHHQLGRELVATIPAEVSVLAQAQLVPYVAHRYRLGIWSGPLLTDYDYIWLDLSHPKFPNRFNAQSELLTGLTIEPDFGFVATQDGYLLLKKGSERVPISDDLFTFTQFDQLPSDAQPFAATFGDTLKLVGVKPEVRRLATSETEPQVVLFFNVLQKPAEDYHLFVYLLDQTGAITGATDYPQPAMFWWPTSRWQTGEQRQIRVNTLPWWTGDKTTFAYALGLSRSEDPWDVSARLPVTLTGQAGNPPGVQLLDNGTLLTLVAFRRFAGLPYPKPLTILPEVGSRD